MIGSIRPSMRALALAVPALLTTACSGVAPSPTASPSPSASARATQVPTATPTATATQTLTPSPSATATAASLLIKVTHEGGFINPTASLAALPTVDVDTDGRIYTPGLSADGSSRLIQPVDVREVGADGAAQILAAIKAAGLNQKIEDTGVVADAGEAVFTVVVDGQKVVNRLASPMGGPGHPGGEPGGPGGSSASPGASSSAAQAAFDLLARLSDPSETWGAPSAPATTYEPLGYVVYEAPVAAAGDSSVAWPLPTSLADFGAAVTGDYGVDGLRSGVVIGSDAATLGAAVKNADASATATSGGKSYTVWIRALLPDELR